MRRFEVVTTFLNKDIVVPERATTKSAGYDLRAAEDCIIPSLFKTILSLGFQNCEPLGLDEHASLVKSNGLKPTMVKTGLKISLADNEELELRSRSSVSTKNLAFLANGVGTIDADYYNNSENEGHIMVPLVNFSPFDIYIKKGERVAQALIKEYKVTDNDAAFGERQGGFGSSGNE